MTHGYNVTAARAERAEVDHLIRKFRREWNAQRLRLFRQHLQVTVTTATPLLPRIVEDQDVDLRRALLAVRPSHRWPDGPRPNGWPSISQVLGHPGRRSIGDLGRYDLGRSILVRDGGDPLGPLVLRIVEGGLELTTRVGDATIRTGGGFVHIVLDFHLPDTLESVVVGRSASCIVRHPWFEDARWIIDGVRRDGETTVVSIASGQESFSMPWRDLLARART